MEEPKDKQKSKRRIIISIIISASLIIFTVSIVLSSTIFLSSGTPEREETDADSSGKQLAETMLPSSIEETLDSDTDIVYENKNQEISIIPIEPKYSNTFVRAEGADVPTEKTFVSDIPRTVLDMSLFINDNPTLTNEEIDLLLSYAVGKERGITDEEVDQKVIEIMMEYIENEKNN